MSTAFGELVQTKRNLMGLSMRELAKRTLVDVSYISKLESGKLLMPSFSTTMRISKELGINMETLQSVFELNEDVGGIIQGEVQNSVTGAEKEAVQGIVEGIVQLTDSPDFDIDGMGALLQKVYTLHQQKHKRTDMFSIITIEDKRWVRVLETPVVDNQLITLYHQAMEVSEEDSFIIKGEIISYPDYFSESQVLTLEGLLDKCSSVNEEDDTYIYFSDLKEHLEQVLGNTKRL